MTTEAAEVHEGACAAYLGGLDCGRCEEYEASLAELSDHPDPCWYMLKATVAECVEHLRTRLPECDGFWPDVTKHLAETYDLPEERVRELRGAPRDEDGWPVGMTLTQKEYYMLQDAGEDLQKVREGLATDDAIDFLVEALRRGGLAVDRGEDHVSFDHAGHHFTAEVELDKEAS